MSIFSRKTVEVQEPLLDHTIYLIDTENVRTVWTLLLDRMTVNDKIYVFYTMNSGNVSYEDLNGVLSSGKSVELIQCHTGKNGLDFQLVSYLGYLIRNNENADYCIISDDSGYDAVIKFWEGRDVDVTRKTAFQVSGKQAKPVKKPLFGSKSKAKSQPAKPKSVEEKKKTDPTDNIFKSEPVKLTPVNLDQIQLVNQPKKTDTMQSAADKKTIEKNAAEKKPGDRKTVDKKTAGKKTSEKKSSDINSNETQSADTEALENKIATVNLSDKKTTDENTSENNLSDNKASTKKHSVKKAGTPRTSSNQDLAEVASKTDKTQAASKKASQEPAKPASPEMLSKLRELLPEEPDDRLREISEIISKSGKNGLADIHDEIEKLYRNEMASDIYRTIRRNIKDICC
jgi:hypothetical protein